MRQLYPNLFFLLHLLNIFPLSVASVEKLFLRMKLIKMRLINQLSLVRLDKLLRIDTETPEDGYNDNVYVYKYFVVELQKAGYATDPNYAKKIHSIMDGSILRNALHSLQEVDSSKKIVSTFKYENSH